MDTNKIEVWNTGRLYGREGQVIAAMPVDGGVVFADVTRMIDGFVAATPERIAREGVRAVAMWGYDTGAPTGGGGYKYNYENCWQRVPHETVQLVTRAGIEYAKQILNRLPQQGKAK